MSSQRSGGSSIPAPDASLLDLLADCTLVVQSLASKKTGTGFFVAPNLVLTCRHTVEDGSEQEISIHWKRRPLKVTRRQFPVSPPPVDLEGAVRQADPPEPARTPPVGSPTPSC